MKFNHYYEKINWYNPSCFLFFKGATDMFELTRDYLDRIFDVDDGTFYLVDYLLI